MEIYSWSGAYLELLRLPPDVIKPKASSITSANLAAATTASGLGEFSVRWLTMDSGEPREWIKYSDGTMHCSVCRAVVRNKRKLISSSCPL